MIFSPTMRRKRGLQLRISERRLLLMAGDALVVIFSIVIALGIWASVAEYAFDLQFLTPQFTWFFVLTSVWFLLAGANDYYELSIAADKWQSFQRLIVITLQLLVVYVLVFFLSDRDSLPRLFIVYYGIVSFFLLLIARFLNPALIGWASSTRRVLVVGTDWAAETIIITLSQHAKASYNVLGIIGDSDTVEHINGIPVVGNASEMLEIIAAENVSEIIVTNTNELPGDLFQSVMDAYEYGVSITPMPILYERITERVPVEHVGTHWTIVLPIGGTSVFNPYPLLKRIMDVTMAGVGLILFAFLFPFLALAIYIDSRGSIFYRQERVGLHGRRFNIIKLRTMIPNAEQNTGAKFAEKNDSRITRVGNFLRRTRLDELPQLLNVLRGDMSMIGPRPERPEHVVRLQKKIPFYRTRHTIRPGLTGWAQVRFDYVSSDEDTLTKLQYDLYYIRHQSVLLDLNILIRTVGKVLTMSGR